MPPAVPAIPLPGEEWRPVFGWEGLYEVSSLGRVRSLDRMVKSHTCPDCGHSRSRPVKGRLLHQQTDVDGYLRVSLSAFGRPTKVKGVHVLVAEAFIGPRPAGMQVLHNDGKAGNPLPSNLRYGTPTDNAADRIRHNGGYYGTWVAKLTEDDVRAIRASPADRHELAAVYGVTYQCISGVQRRKSWAHVE